MTQYTAFLLSETTKQDLFALFPARYAQLIADHITYEFGVNNFGSLSHPQAIEITAMVDNKDGLQALVVKIDGQQIKPDGLPYHITWSLDPDKHKPFDSNALIKDFLENKINGLSFEKLDPPILISAAAVHIDQSDIENRIISPLPKNTPSVPRPPRP